MVKPATILLSLVPFLAAIPSAIAAPSQLVLASPTNLVIDPTPKPCEQCCSKVCQTLPKKPKGKKKRWDICARMTGLSSRQDEPGKVGVTYRMRNKDIRAGDLVFNAEAFDRHGYVRVDFENVVIETPGTIYININNVWINEGCQVVIKLKDQTIIHDGDIELASNNRMVARRF
jgi:hypothetical protein